MVGGGEGTPCLSTTLCIETDALCNGIDDCRDGEDERECPESDDCRMKRELVQKLNRECPLRNQTLQGIPDTSRDRWTFNSTGNIDQEYVTQVKLSTSRQNAGGGTVLYQVRVGSFSSSRFLFNNDTPLSQTRELPIPVLFDPGNINVTVEMLNIDEFRSISIQGLELNITLYSGNCDDSTLNCLLSVADLLSDDLSCSKNLGGNIYTSVYNSDVCPLRPDCADNQLARLSGLCIPSDAMCDGFNDCTGANEDECPFTCNDIGLCPMVSSNLLFEKFTLCSEVRKVSFETIPTLELSFLWDYVEAVVLTEIVVPSNVSIIEGLNRWNISSSSSSLAVYHQILSRRERSDIPVLLKRPPILNPGDRVTVTREFTPDYFREPFVRRPASVTEVNGFPLTSCESNFNCTDMLTTREKEENQANCAFSVYEDFLLDSYCRGFCNEDFLNNTLAGELTFSMTNIGTTANSTEVCPSYTDKVGEPRAFRTCVGNFVSPSYWDEVELNNCYEDVEKEPDDDLKELNKFLDNNSLSNENVTSVSYDVADATQTTDLDGDDLVIVAEILEKITIFGSPSPKVTRNIVRVVDIILNVEVSEGEVYNESTLSESSSRIVQSLETQLTNLHRGGGDNLNFTEVRGYIAVKALAVNEDYVTSEITFGNFFTSEENDITETLNNSLISIFEGPRPYIADDVKASITLPSNLLDEFQGDSSRSIGVSFLVYRTSNLFVSRGSQTAQEVQSLIVAATIEEEKVENLESPIVTRFYLLPVEESVSDSTRRCVFWNFSLAGGFGDWSSEGCTLVSGPGENGERIVECHCDHLTNFAILVDLQGDIGNIVLDVLSIIGCVVSIIALTIILVTFLSVKILRSKRSQQVLINLCFALLGLYLSFLIGINRSNLTVGCVIFGAMIHYFCLASVAWMCVEATIMYLLFVKVFDSGIRYFMRKASVIAWGLPLLVVVLSAVIRPNNYTGNYCFPQAGTLTFTIAVAVLLVVMLCYNLIMFLLVIRTLTCRKRSIEVEKSAETIKRVQNAIAISVLLGLGWLFGFLAIGGAQMIFNLLFLILNSLQGFFVVVFFYLRNKDVLLVWRANFSPAKQSISDPQVLKKSEENCTSVVTDGTNTIPREATESSVVTDSARVDSNG